MRILDWLFDIADWLPGWLVPAFAGAILTGGIVSVRLLFALPALFTHPAMVGEALVAVAAGAAGGAAGGLAYSLLGRPLLKVPWAGPYLAGMVLIGGYLGALAFMIPYIDPDATRRFRSPAGALGYVSCVLIFGTLIGRSLFTGPYSLARDLTVQPGRTQSPAEFRRARMERRRLARSAAERADADDARPV